MDFNIVELYQKISESIEIIEKSGKDEKELEKLKDDFHHFLDAIKFFLISNRDAYYGYFLINLEYFIDFTLNVLAGVKINTFPIVLTTNPLLLGKLTIKEIIFVICHEIDHIVFNHPTLMLKENPNYNNEIGYLFNLAADSAVNDKLIYEMINDKRDFLSVPKGIITSQTIQKLVGKKDVRPLQSYKYYFDLIKKINVKEILGNYDYILAEKNNNSSEQSEIDYQDVVTINNFEKIDDHNWTDSKETEEVNAMVKELINSSYEIISAEKRYGMPAYFVSQVEKINKPAEIPWQVVLKKYIGSISSGKRKTRTRLNRRQPNRFDIPGKIDEKILKIVVAIDTSGSVDDEMISDIFSEIFAIIAKRKSEVSIIECDAKVQRVYKVKNQSEVKKSVKGRGGTAFSPVIEFINNDRYYRDAVLIYFTDGFGEEKIEKPRTYKNIWVVFNDKNNLSVEEPYGEVLTIKGV